MKKIETYDIYTIYKTKNGDFYGVVAKSKKYRYYKTGEFENIPELKKAINYSRCIKNEWT